MDGLDNVQLNRTPLGYLKGHGLGDFSFLHVPLSFNNILYYCKDIIKCLTTLSSIPLLIIIIIEREKEICEAYRLAYLFRDFAWTWHQRISQGWTDCIFYHADARWAAQFGAGLDHCWQFIALWAISEPILAFYGAGLSLRGAGLSQWHSLFFVPVQPWHLLCVRPGQTVVFQTNLASLSSATVE